MLLGHRAEWHEWDSEHDGRIAEAIVELDRLTQMHVFVSGTPDQVHALRLAAEAMSD